jgi:hypothetical protein
VTQQLLPSRVQVEQCVALSSRRRHTDPEGGDSTHPTCVCRCRAGLLSNIPSAQLRQQLDAPAGVDALVQLSEKFVSDIRAGRHAQEGWSNSMYGEYAFKHS